MADTSFRQIQNPDGSYTYLIGGAQVSKSEFDNARQQDRLEMQKMREQDDDPDVAAMRARAKARASSKSSTTTFNKPNSLEQYNSEKAAGGPLTDLTYKQWKQLD